MTLEKQAIARAVADCIGDGDTIFINSGSTMQAVAEHPKVAGRPGTIDLTLAKPSFVPDDLTF